MRKKDEKKHTNNSRVYKMTVREEVLGCSLCPPNKGCNKNRNSDNKSWKNYRDNQWKQQTHMPLEEAQIVLMND